MRHDSCYQGTSLSGSLHDVRKTIAARCRVLGKVELDFRDLEGNEIAWTGFWGLWEDVV